MPIKSKAQWRLFGAKHHRLLKKWQKEHPVKYKDLPDKVAESVVRTLIEHSDTPEWIDTLIKAEEDGAGIGIDFVSNGSVETYYATSATKSGNIANEVERLGFHLQKLYSVLTNEIQEEYDSTVGAMSDSSWDWEDLESDGNGYRFSRNGKFLGYEPEGKSGKLLGVPFSKLNSAVQDDAFKAYWDSGIPQDNFDLAQSDFKSNWDEKLEAYDLNIKGIYDGKVSLVGRVSDVDAFLKKLKSTWPGALGKVLPFDPFNL